jgi:regulator of RNase E activity RraB
LYYDNLVGDNYAPISRINDTDITFYTDEFKIDLTKFDESCYFGYLSNTSSMLPTVDDTHNVIICKDYISNLKKGDIISYNYSKHRILHRIEKIGLDNEGWYAYLKGDNIKSKDPFKVRQNQINGVVVVIIY